MFARFKNDEKKNPNNFIIKVAKTQKNWALRENHLVLKLIFRKENTLDTVLRKLDAEMRTHLTAFYEGRYGGSMSSSSQQNSPCISFCSLKEFIWFWVTVFQSLICKLNQKVFPTWVNSSCLVTLFATQVNTRVMKGWQFMTIEKCPRTLGWHFETCSHVCWFSSFIISHHSSVRPGFVKKSGIMLL